MPARVKESKSGSARQSIQCVVTSAVMDGKSMEGRTRVIESNGLRTTCILPCEANVSKNENELSFSWPENMGKGSLNMVRLQHGLLLGILNFTLNEEIFVPYRYHNSTMVFGSCILGTISYSVKNKEEDIELNHESGRSFISFIPEHHGIARIQTDFPIVMVGVYADSVLLDNLLDDQENCFLQSVKRIILKEKHKYWCQSSATSAAIKAVVHRILECPYQGLLRHLYLESKSLELIAVALAEADQTHIPLKKGYDAMRSNDLKRVRRARELVERDLQNPPKLLDLARAVGMPHPRLNCCFREEYGTTVFGYLREIRLNKAKILLDEGRMNVGEVAYEVGYSSLSHFAKAFKSQFGKVPCHYLRESN